jgi:stage II sporulation protein D
VPSFSGRGRAALVVRLVVGCAAVACVGIGTEPLYSQRASAPGAVGEPQLERASGGHRVSLHLGASGRVTSLPMEVYVARVVAGEAEPDAAPAAREALAIAVRTYAVVNARRHGREGFGLCDTTHCQVLRASTAATRAAAYATAGRILTYNGSPAEVFYSASCGGRSERAFHVWPGADLPYLQSIVDDVHEEETPWTLEMPLRDVQQALTGAGFTGVQLTGLRVDERNESGRVMRLRLEGLQPDAIAGAAFRNAIGPRALRSTAFVVQQPGDDTVRFLGVGYGHGVGMCVIGAGARARRGENAAEILGAYYPGLRIDVHR